MREICLVRLDKTRPAFILTRDAARHAMTEVTVASITTTIKGLSSEISVGPDNGLDHDCAISLANVLTVPVSALGRTFDNLDVEQEAQLARTVSFAFDLEVPLVGWRPMSSDPRPTPRGWLTQSMVLRSPSASAGFSKFLAKQSWRSGLPHDAQPPEPTSTNPVQPAKFTVRR